MARSSSRATPPAAPALIAFKGAFHGRTYGAMSLTSSKVKAARRLRPAAARRLSCAVRVSVPLRVRAGARRLRAALHRRDRGDLFARQLDPRDVAAIFVEPIQGEGGYVVPPPGFLRALRALCDKHGILLVCDEIQCGVGRTGKMWACEHAGVEPDILLTAKGLGSGMPIGAIIAKDRSCTWESGAHGSTFGGNPVCCAAALATLDCRRAASSSPNARRAWASGSWRVRGCRRSIRRIGDVRGLGLMIGVEFVKDRATREPAPELARRARERAFERGLLLLGARQEHAAPRAAARDRRAGHRHRAGDHRRRALERASLT